MNAAIAELLRDRIAAFTYVDKIAGLVRPITYQRLGPDGKTVNITIPVGIDVVDPLECSEDTQLALVPNEAYGVIVYFEDRGVGIGERQGRATRVSRLRLVCWVNTSKLNGNNYAGDTIAQEFEGALNGAIYNSDAFIGIRHKVEGFPAKGPGLFSQYTYPEGVRQYLMWPFDAFAIDIATEYMPNPACVVPIDPTDVNCWTPPVTRRRRNPKDFTCEELTDPITGLTTEQLIDCLNCSGSAMPGIIHRDNLAAMLADNATVPTLQQIVVNDETMDTYYGAPPLTVRGLALAKKYALGVIHVDEGGPSEGLDVTLPSAQLHIQLNA